MNPARKYAHDLMQSHEYKVVLETVEKICPVVPAFDYRSPNGKEGNIEEIKFKLAQKQMHELVLKILKGESQ